MHWRGVAVVAAIGLVGTLSSCGGDGEGAASSEPPPRPKKLTISVTDHPSKNKVRFHAPKTVKAGLYDITLNNLGRDPHTAELLRVEGDHTKKQVSNMVVTTVDGPRPPSWVTDGGGIGYTLDGNFSKVTQVLEPGTYYIADTLDGGTFGLPGAHMRIGGLRKLEVTGSTDAEIRPTNATITADEYSFDVSGIKAGTNRLTIENDGDKFHRVIIYGIWRDSGFEKAKELFHRGIIFPVSEPTPLKPTPAFSSAMLAPGDQQQTDLVLTPGIYVIASLMSDARDAPFDADKGMLAELEVE